jgi:hypothetical protein
MIGSRLNLVCAAGHRHYAPPRELVAWVGHECLAGASMRVNGFPAPGRCQELLYPDKVPDRWMVSLAKSAGRKEP